MLNVVSHKKIKRMLKRSGRIPIASTDQEKAVINVLPDKRSISRSLLNILREADERISPIQIASYLGVDVKTVHKQMTRFSKNPVAKLTFKKVYEGNKVFYYSLLPKNADLEAFYYVIRIVNKMKEVNE